MPRSDAVLRRERLGRGAVAALVVVGLAAGATILLGPVGKSASAAGDRCGIGDESATLARPMPHVAARIAAGGTLTIVALGSSSTSGTGASRPEYTYPSRLAAALEARYPGLKVRMVNRGVPGDEAPGMAARISRDVLPEKPDLVIWQVGTNGVLNGDDAFSRGEVLRAGIEQIKDVGADVMLMNLQYAPAVLRHPHYRDMLHVIDAVAYAEDVPLFPRFAIMRQWAEEGRMPLKVMLSRDRLHMTDVSYNCLARGIAASIDAVAAPRELEAVLPAKTEG